MNIVKCLLKLWLILLSVVALLPFAVGLAKIVFDQNIINGGFFIITSLVFGTSVFLLQKSRKSPSLLNPLLNLGFILSIIGLADSFTTNLNIGIWVLGISLFVLGIFVKGKNAATTP